MAFLARWLVAASLILLFVGGCGDGLGAIPVKGKVFYQGQPLNGGMVLYSPVDPNGRQARGEISSSGEFTLTTLKAEDGALPGEYKVVIEALEPHPGEPGRGSTPADAPAPTIERKSRIPAQYTAADETPFTDTVDSAHPGYKEWKIE